MDPRTRGTKLVIVREIVPGYKYRLVLLVYFLRRRFNIQYERVLGRALHVEVARFFLLFFARSMHSRDVTELYVALGLCEHELLRTMRGFSLTVSDTHLPPPIPMKFHCSAPLPANMFAMLVRLLIRITGRASIKEPLAILSW